MRFGHQVLQQIRQALRLADIVGQRVTLSQSGAQLRGPCPFHQEKDPSFYVYPEKGFFICYGCQAKGDVFDFLMLSEGLTFSDAVQKAALLAGIELTPVSDAEHEDERRREQHRQRLYKANEEAAAFFQERLQGIGAAHARDYLDKRGLGPEVLHRYRIGYAPDLWDALTAHMESRGMLDAAEELGLVRKSQQGKGHYDFFRNRIMFPIRDSFGNVRGFSSRILDASRPEGKYVNSPESAVYTKSHSVYGLHEVQRQMRQENRIILVEGNIDVLTLAQAGFPAAAPLGTALTAAQLQILRRYTQNIWLMFDGDAAGRKATLRAVSLLMEGESTGKIVLLPEPHDPDSFLRENGPEPLRALMEKAMPVFDTYLRMTLPPPEAPISQRVAALTPVADLWKWVPPAARDAYIKQIAIMLRIEPPDVRSVLSPRGPSGFRVPATTARPAAPRLAAEEKTEFNWMLHLVCFLHYHEDAPIDIENLETGNFFGEPTVRDAWRQIREGRLWRDLAQVKELLPEEIAAGLPGLCESMKKLAHPEETLGEILVRFKEQDIRRRIREINARMQDLGPDAPLELRRNLLEERMRLEQARNLLVQNRGIHDSENKIGQKTT